MVSGLRLVGINRSVETDDSFRYRPRVSEKVLLREPERCSQCFKVFVSLYPLATCVDHEGLDSV